MSRTLKHLLFAVLLLCAQMLAAAHAVEHGFEAVKGQPPHVCELCLAAHDLGAGLTADIPAPLAVAAEFIPAHYFCSDRDALPAPQARQQAPPLA